MTSTPTRGGNVVSAGVIGGELIIGLSDGSIINAGLIQGSNGPKGDPGPPGPKGDDGADGRTLLNGPRPPQPDEGQQGDFWMDTVATALWGPKEASGRWPGPVYLLSEAVRRDRARGPGRPQGGAQFFGGTGPTTATQAQPQQGLKPIDNNGQPLPAATDIKIADSTTGTVFDLKIRAESATGVWVGTVTVANFGSVADHDVYSELMIGPVPPVLTFTPVVTGNVLSVSVSSNQPLVKIEGVIIEVG